MGQNNPIDSLAVAIFKDDPDFDLLVKNLNISLWNNINIIINYQSNATQYVYRNAYFYPYNHDYYSSIGWGGFTGGKQLAILGVTLYLNEGTEQGDKILQSISYY